MNHFKKTFLILFFLLVLETLFISDMPLLSRWISIFSLASIGAYIISAILKKQFNEFTKAVKRVKQNDYLARLDDIKSGELNEFAYEFNTLAEQLAVYKESFERREGELVGLINSIPFGIIYFDEDSSVRIFNQAIKNMFKDFNPDYPLTSIHIPSLNNFVNRAIEENVVRRETFYESSGGMGRAFDITFIPLQKYYALLFNDVTLEKNIERIKYDLVSNVSHELKTPIASLSIMVDVFEEERDDEKRKEFICKIKNQIERINNLLNDLFSLTRIEGGEYLLRYEKLYITSIINDVIEELEMEIKKRGISVHYDIKEEISINSDRYLLQSIFKNIIENGVKYNKQNGFLFIRGEKKENIVIVEVEDSGEGIPDEYKERIFERFFRIDSHRSRDLGGSGLGLSIVKHSLKLLGGNIEVDSQMGKGSKFIVKIPDWTFVAKSQ